MTKRLLTSGELARKLNVSPGTIARYAREGRLIPVDTTPGGHHRWDEDDVRDQMRRLRAEERAERERRESGPAN